MTQELKKLPIGISDFKEVITQNYYYLDKTLLIKEILDLGSKATLIPRPRRFGKTLNMSMLNYFFAKQLPDYSENSAAYNAIQESPACSGHRQLFDGLAIAKLPDYMDHQGQYPVIALTFKFIEGKTWSKCFAGLKKLIAEEYRKHLYLLQSKFLDEHQKKLYRAIIDTTASEFSYQSSLKQLTEYLAKYHHKHPIVLIDEYDVPINTGYLSGYYSEVVEFIKLFFGDGLKDNSYLEFAVITGVLRIARESIFSGLNHLVVYTFLDNHYADKFGLLPEEVAKLIDYYGYQDKLDDVQEWYNGYQSGNYKIYNPWSMLNFISRGGLLDAYWINTSNNDLIKEIIQKCDETVITDIELLMQYKVIKEKEINSHLSFADIWDDENSLWSFLLLSGYLTFTNKRTVGGITKVDLLIPNKEIAFFYRATIVSWFKKIKKPYSEVVQSLITGDIGHFKQTFEAFALTSFSYFDTRGTEPEKFYHAFMLGLLVDLRQEYEVSSNRESGSGRYDVTITPYEKEKPGIILEFKKVDKYRKETLETAAEKALIQIQARQYAATMRAQGIKTIISLGIAFYGKDALVKGFKYRENNRILTEKETIALNLLAQNVTSEIISLSTGLSLEQINELKKITSPTQE